MNAFKVWFWEHFTDMTFNTFLWIDHGNYKTVMRISRRIIPERIIDPEEWARKQQAYQDYLEAWIGPFGDGKTQMMIEDLETRNIPYIIQEE